MCESVITMTFLRRRRSDKEAEYVHAGAYAEIAPGEIRRVGELPVILCRAGDRLYALSWVCPHAAAKLARGRIVDDCLECPLHKATFALATGEVRTGPAQRNLLTYDVRVRDGQVYVSRTPNRPTLLSRLRRPAYEVGVRRRAR